MCGIGSVGKDVESRLLGDSLAKGMYRVVMSSESSVMPSAALLGSWELLCGDLDRLKVIDSKCAGRWGTAIALFFFSS